MEWAIKVAILVSKYQHPDIIVSGRVIDEDRYEAKFRLREKGLEVLVDIDPDLNLRLYPKFGKITGAEIDHYVEMVMLVRNFMKAVEDG